MDFKFKLTVMLPLFPDYFPIFEAGIANTISSSKWRKRIIFMNKCTYNVQNVIIRLTKHLSQNILAIRVEIIGLKFAWKWIQSLPAA